MDEDMDPHAGSDVPVLIPDGGGSDGAPEDALPDTARREIAELQSDSESLLEQLQSLRAELDAEEDERVEAIDEVLRFIEQQSSALRDADVPPDEPTAKAQADIEFLREEFRGDLAELREDLEAEIDAVREEVDSVAAAAAEELPERVEDLESGLESVREQVSSLEDLVDDVAEIDVEIGEVADDVDDLEDDVDDLEDEVDATTGEVTDMAGTVSDLTQRIDALKTDLEDHKRSSKREREQLLQSRIEDFALRMLQVKDALDRMIDREDMNEEAERGIEMVQRQFEQQLTSGPISKIDTSGTYDPDFHELKETVDAEDAEKNEIVEVVQDGYEIGGNVIRPARVIVAKGENE